MKERIDFINAGLFVILISISTVFLTHLWQDSYFEKQSWNIVVNADGSESQSVQIVSARFWNDEHKEDYQELGQYEVLSIITKNKESFVGYDSDAEKSLYPNVFEVDWFSFVDKQFYHFKGTIPHEKIKEFVKEAKSTNSKKVTFCATLLPNGKVKISVGTQIESSEYPKKYNLTSIETFQAKVVQNDWKMLISNNSRFENVATINDYTEIITKKRLWYFIIAMPANAQVQALFMNAFNDDEINAPNYDKITQPKERLLPSEFQLQWTIDANDSYRTDWKFKGDEILNAFKRLESLSPKEPIKIFFLRDDDVTKYQLAISNSKEVIYLKNAVESEVSEMN